jgi:N-acyl homoserine lactone hydrolase
VYKTLLAVCVLVLSAADVLGQGTAAAELRLYAMDCARMRTNGILASNPCFLVRHPRGDLLWDAGLPQTLVGAPGAATKIGSAEVTVTRTLPDMLSELGMVPADIEFLSMSHTHLDHVGNAGLFPSATWIVDVDEREWAFRPAARTSPVFASYQVLEHAPTRLIEGDADADVFGDGQVVIVQAPGHTPGHTVLLLRLSQAGVVLIAGDLWNTPDAGAARRGTPQALASMDKIEAIATRNGARVVRHHVLEDFEALPRFPDFLR